MAGISGPLEIQYGQVVCRLQQQPAHLKDCDGDCHKHFGLAFMGWRTRLTRPPTSTGYAKTADIVL